MRPNEYPRVEENFGTVVFDLDGTIAGSVWPEREILGAPIKEGVRMLKYYANLGYTIIVHTARRKADEDMIWAWIKHNQLPVDRVICEKPIAGLYVDDRGYKFERTV